MRTARFAAASFLVALMAASATSASAAHMLPYNPNDRANWLTINFAESPPTGVAFRFVNNYNQTWHTLASTGNAVWLRKAPIGQENGVSLIWSPAPGSDRYFGVMLTPDENTVNTDITITIGAAVQTSHGPTWNATVDSAYGSRQVVGGTSVPESSASWLLLVVPLAVVGRRLIYRHGPF